MRTRNLSLAFSSLAGRPAPCVPQAGEVPPSCLSRINTILLWYVILFIYIAGLDFWIFLHFCLWGILACSRLIVNLEMGYMSPLTLFFFKCLKFFFLIFTYFERASERERAAEEQRERKRENPKQAPCCQHRTWHGAWTHKLQDGELSWNQESTLNQLKHPGTL